MKIPLEAAVEYKIIYIPVDDDTEGGTPMLRSKGLNITPPPSPRAPDTQPPKEAKITSLSTLEPVKAISPSTKPFPYLILSDCSLFTSIIAEIVIIPQNIINAP